MTVGRSNTFERVAAVVVRTFALADASAISRMTTSADVSGWDSLSHAMLLMAIEEEFVIDFPLDRVSVARNVGELADLVDELAAK